MVAELFHAVENVEDARYSREHACAEEPCPQKVAVRNQIPAQQNPNDYNHLKNGGYFARDMRADDDFAHDRAYHDRADGQEEVPSDNGTGQP